MTATSVLAPNGSRPPLFFSSTLPSSASALLVATCAGEVALADVVTGGGSLKKPKRNISVRIGSTWELSTAREREPFCTAACRGAPK